MNGHIDNIMPPTASLSKNLYESRSINKLQNDIILLVFKI